MTKDIWLERENRGGKGYGDNVRWVDTEHYIDNYTGEVVHYSLYSKMEWFFQKIIFDLVCEGLSSEKISKRLQNMSGGTKLSPRRIREIINDEINVDAWTWLGYSEEKRQKLEKIMRWQRVGRKTIKEYDALLLSLVDQGYNSNEIAAKLAEQGCKISRRTVYRRLKTLAEEHGYTVVGEN